jgi:hypothetical protein
VVNTPTTRPPNRPRSERRPPKGPSVARSRRLTPELTRARLTVASDTLRAGGHPDLAEAVDAILAPRGWELLKREVKDSGQPNLSISTHEPVKQAIEQAAAAAGTTVTAVVDEAFRAFLAGEFEPTQPVRYRRGTAPAKAVINVRPDAELRRQVEEAAQAKSAELGWRLNAGRIAVSYMVHKYGIAEAVQAE